MVDINELNVGDIVKIVDKWTAGCNQNYDGLMDHWLGKTMTVRAVGTAFVEMEEDHDECHGDGWAWNRPCIEYVVSRANSFEPEPLDDEQVLSLFMK